MARSTSRSPLFHKGLTVYTSNGDALPLAEPSPADSTAQETEASDTKVLSARHKRWSGDIGRDDGA
jgi:hypothetical protein